MNMTIMPSLQKLGRNEINKITMLTSSMQASGTKDGQRINLWAKYYFLIVVTKDFNIVWYSFSLFIWVWCFHGPVIIYSQIVQ